MYITEKLSTRICQELTKQEIISSEISVYYQYAFDFVFDLIIFNGSLIVLGAILNAPLLALLYVLILTSLKMLSGGAHAGSRLSCSAISYTVFLSTILLIKHQILVLSPAASIPSFLLSVILILLFAPVDCKSKRIAKDERTQYKCRCFIFVCILSPLFMFFIINGHYKYFSLMTICVIIIVVNQIIGIIINNIGKRKE